MECYTQPEFTPAARDRVAGDADGGFSLAFLVVMGFFPIAIAFAVSLPFSFTVVFSFSLLLSVCFAVAVIVAGFIVAGAQFGRRVEAWQVRPGAQDESGLADAV